jgi:hypothetical protein
VYKFHRPKKTFLKRHALTLSMTALGAAAVSFGFLMPANSGVDGNARVFTEGLNINLDRSSPAYAALEDSWTSSNVAAKAPAESFVDTSAHSVELAAGHEATITVAEKITRSNRREESLIAQERASREANTQAMAQAAVRILRTMTSQLETQLTPPASTQARQDQAAVESAQALEEPAAQSHETRTISLSDLKISREELLGSLFLPIAKSDRDMPLAASLPRLPASFPNRPANAAADLNDSASIKNAKPTSAVYSSTAEAGDSQATAPILRQAVIAGSVEFTDGLALANTMDRVVVYREVDGDALESGAVWLREGRYEIFVEDTSGFLIAELRTPYGDVVGRGSFDLTHLPVTSRTQRRVEPVALKIKPVHPGISGHITASRSDGRNPAMKGARIEFRDLPLQATANREGQYEQPNLVEGSSAIVKATRPGYWGTLVFAHAGIDNDIEIFPNQDGQMIHHLVALSRSAKVSADSSAIIWGRVMRNGKAIAGARVELPTTSDFVRPIYFNAAMVPDLDLKETSSNGLYAFFPVVPGAHGVQAVIGDSVTEPILFPAEQRTVSRVDIETSVDRKAKIRVFDAFKTDTPLAAEVMNPGAQRGVSIDSSGVGEVKYTGGRGLLILDTDSGPNYERIRIAMSRDRRSIYIPMIQSAWLQRVRGALKVNTELNAGTIVGFVQGSSPYKIAMEERSLLPSSRLIYFNSRGEALPQDYGEPGGGFVIFNVPEGFRTVTVQSSGSAKIHSSVALVESRVTSVISHWIR